MGICELVGRAGGGGGIVLDRGRVVRRNVCEGLAATACLTPEQIEAFRKKQAGNFAILFVCDLVLAAVVGGLAADLKPETALAGASLGFWLWLGLAATQTLTLNTAAGKPSGLFWIDVGKQLAGLLAMGAILGAWR